MHAFSTADQALMTRAVQLARRGLYTTMPNPRVGCVLARDGQVVGEGWHQWVGTDHAEIVALKAAGSQAKGATVYVTLEPCCHHGRTPPCVDALIKAGVAKVIVGMRDPNPLVAGRGLQQLRAAGITVYNGLLAAEAQSLNPGFCKRMATGQPYVRAKLAMSLDGRTAMASGESQWITGLEARSEGQRLRAASCAVMTGIGSILHDDASLTLRAQALAIPNAQALCERRQPLRVVLDSTLRTPVDAKVITGPGSCLILTTPAANTEKKAALIAAGANVHVQVQRTDRVCLTAVLAELGRRACNEVLLEAGATLAGAMLQANLLDELIIFMAPTLLGDQACPLLQLPVHQLSERWDLNVTDVRAIGNDWQITAQLAGC